MEQGDDRLPDTSNMMIDVAMVPLILIKPRGVTAILLEKRWKWKYSANVVRAPFETSNYHARTMEREAS